MPAIDEEDIEQAVIVVIEQRHPAAHCLNQVLLRRGGVPMLKADALRCP